MSWIGVDLDGTLAFYGGWAGPGHIGEPVPAMAERVKRWLAEDKEVRIFTARIYPLNRCFMPDDPVLQPSILDGRTADAIGAVHAIRDWCRKHLGVVLPVTNIKDYSMVDLYDDRAWRVRANTGEIVE